MTIPPASLINHLRETYPAGTRVQLLAMNDTQAPPIGTHGTVIHVDSMATIHVAWDTGSTLGVVYGEDRIAKL